MNPIRAIGFGLIITAYLMVELTIKYSKEVMNSEPFFFIAALNAITPNVTDVGGIKEILPAAFIVMCIGVGLILGVLVERIFCAILDSLFTSGQHFVSNIYKAKTCQRQS